MFDEASVFGGHATLQRPGHVNGNLLDQVFRYQASQFFIGGKLVGGTQAVTPIGTYALGVQLAGILQDEVAPIVLKFDSGIRYFGGYFNHQSYGIDGITLEFFSDPNATVSLGIGIVDITDSFDLTWNGWGIDNAGFANGQSIRSVKLTSKFYAMDGLVAGNTYTPVPEPASLVVLGLGAVAAMRRRRR